MSNKFATCLWFDNQAEQAAEFYTSVFAGSRIHDIGRNPDGSALVVNFELEGQRFMGLNGGPQFPLTEAVSIYVNCDTQDEVDDLWARLTADGGEESQCGWLKDKFGLSWQIIPTALPKLLGDRDPERARRAMEAMLRMRKIDIAAIEAAAAGSGS